MANIFYIHPENPQGRLIKQVVDALNNQGVIVLPTDSGYALATKIDNKKGQDKMSQIRQLEKGHFFSLLCADLSDIALYARVDNSQFRLLKQATPNPFTFILKASQELPRRVGNKRKTIGIRIPDVPLVQALLSALGEPLLTTTLLLPDAEISQMYIEDIYDRISNHVDVVIDGGGAIFEPTTVLDLSEGMPPILIREGQADPHPYL